MRCDDDGVEVSQEEEPADERVHSLYRHVGKLLLHKSSYGLAEPPDTVRDVPDRAPQPLEDLENEVLEYRNVRLNLLLHGRVVLGLCDNRRRKGREEEGKREGRGREGRGGEVRGGEIK